MKKVLIVFLIFITGFSLNAETLYTYGGQNHDVFLGCLNCNNYSQNSIWNEYGKYGSSYNAKSIWNSYGVYGSDYSAYSPWNSYAVYPPVIVDADGGFYGYLTINSYKANRADFGLAMTLYKYYDLIRNDVGKWYDKIFE